MNAAVELISRNVGGSINFREISAFFEVYGKLGDTAAFLRVLDKATAVYHKLAEEEAEKEAKRSKKKGT